jgi:hypothetical protein
MRVTEAVLAAVPAGNLRVGREDFAAVWDAAERRSVEQGERGVTDWYAAAVAVTCRWIATALVQTQTGRRHLASSPVTYREARAYEELIEAEYLAAERLDQREPELLIHRPGWCEGIQRTLRWAWRHDGPPPFPISAPSPPT